MSNGALQAYVVIADFSTVGFIKVYVILLSDVYDRIHKQAYCCEIMQNTFDQISCKVL